MNRPGKSDKPVVPEKSPNKGRVTARSAERMEERGLAEGNQLQQNEDRTQSRGPSPSALERVRQVARRDKEEQFTALWHHVYKVDRLREAFFGLKRKSAPGVDGQTWQQYERDQESNLQDLSDRLRRGAYRAQPVVRTYIEKASGGQRPLGIPTLEDKIVQRAATRVLNAIYEEDFLGFSYGFRPGRECHDALNALTVGIEQRRVNWVLDADIRGFFDSIDHGWLVKFIEHRIGDRRVIRHVQKWLKAGVLEEGRKIVPEEGTPQGGSISPLLANIYLHYVLDLWAAHWRRNKTTADVIIVRYADDFVVGFQSRSEAERFRTELQQRLQRFGLELHDQKTRLIEFGRYAAQNRKLRGSGKPESFDFLGFTHSCGRSRSGRFQVKRQTSRKKVRSKLKEIKQELRKRINLSVPDVGGYLEQVLKGHYRYFGVPGNWRSLCTIRYEVFRLWWRTLKRRSQRDNMSWERMSRLARRWLPTPEICRAYPWQCLHV